MRKRPKEDHTWGRSRVEQGTDKRNGVSHLLPGRYDIIVDIAEVEKLAGSLGKRTQYSWA